MKKRKFNLLLNIAVLCMCVVAIAIGVYSAKQANLNVSGTVGFNAHNCDVDVNAYIYGDSATSNSPTTDASELGVVRTEANKKQVNTSLIEVRGNDDNTINLGKFYFCDMTEDDKIAPIYIVLELTNQSFFSIDCNASISIKAGGTDVDYIKITKPSEITLKDKNATDSEKKGNLTIKLELNQTTSIDSSSQPTISITLNMYKEEPKATISSDNWSSTSTAGMVFNSNGYDFVSGDTTTNIKLTKDKIANISFVRDLPEDISSYTPAKINTDQKLENGAYPINTYAKTNSTDSTLYDVIVYSQSKIYPTSCYFMFSDWTKLQSVTFDNFYTNNVENMSCVFYKCYNLTTLDVSNFDTTKVTSMSSMFYYCSSLTSLDVSSFNTTNVTSMSQMFRGCSKLTSLDISHFNTLNVTTMSNMFYSCSSLTSLDLSSFDTTKVTDMSYMFYYCGSLTSLDLSSFNTTGVTDMSYMFQICSSLTSLDVSSFNTSNVTNMSYMFSRCNELTILDVSNFDTSNVINFSYMFGESAYYYTNDKITYLDVSNFNTSKAKNMSAMFGGLTALERIDVSGFDTSNVTNMSYMFIYCKSLSEIDVANFDTSKVTYMSGMFSGCIKLTNLAISTFDTSKVTNMSNMFFACSSIKELNVSQFDTANVTDMGGMFAFCKSLTALDVSNFKTDNVTTFKSGSYDGAHDPLSILSVDGYSDFGMFMGLTNVKSLDVSNFNTEKVTNMAAMFALCSSLTELNLSNFNTSKVIDMGGMFYLCSKLKSLNVTSFNTENVTNTKLFYNYGDNHGMFQGCRELVELDLSSFVLNNISDIRYMFYSCTNLKTIYVLSTWNTDKVTSSSSMFSGCTSLVGGAGTTFDSTKTDKTYACIDGSTDANGNTLKGYLTLKT